ncbi:MAG: diguanylate cyclase [Nitrospirota bacterium]|nr:diguanylate cyclase [Nitrospirota bacterium]
MKKEEIKLDWVYPLKKKILFGILAILTLSIIATMVFIAAMLRESLLDDSKSKTQELSHAIETTLSSLMLMRNPDMMQGAMENIGKNNHSITMAFILDRTGRIAYSSDRKGIGQVLDRHAENSCHGCHRHPAAGPHEETTIIERNGMKVHRNVKVIYNEEACFGCHPRSERINGKLIIDRSLNGTYALITKIELLIFSAGMLCIALIIPFLSRVLSRGVNKYIDEIIRQNYELKLLYLLMERLSKTIDFEELRTTVFEILKETLAPDEIHMVFHRSYGEYRMATWTGERDEIARSKIVQGEPLSLVINKWLEGSLNEQEISPDNRLIYVPIQKSDRSLALIIIKKKDEPFDLQRLGLMQIMSSHISVAFENALLYHLAITDELTSIFAQRHFRTSIDKKFLEFEKYGTKLSLLMLDIDDFKKINDTYGHMVGDSVLRDTARSIMFSIRENDLAFRYGGEEFTVILPSTGFTGAKLVAERIRRNLEEHVFEEGTINLHITVSIGASTCPDNAKTAKDLILAADESLYQAKRNGKNNVVVSERRP